MSITVTIPSPHSLGDESQLEDGTLLPGVAGGTVAGARTLLGPKTLVGPKTVIGQRKVYGPRPGQLPGVAGGPGAGMGAEEEGEYEYWEEGGEEIEVEVLEGGVMVKKKVKPKTTRTFQPFPPKAPKPPMSSDDVAGTLQKMMRQKAERVLRKVCTCVLRDRFLRLFDEKFMNLHN